MINLIIGIVILISFAIFSINGLKEKQSKKIWIVNGLIQDLQLLIVLFREFNTFII